MMRHQLRGNSTLINLVVNENNAYIEGGNFGEMKLVGSPVFHMTVKNLENNTKTVINSENCWDRIEVTQKDHEMLLRFIDCEGVKGIQVMVKAVMVNDRISWELEVINNSLEYSVMEISYPTPVVTAERYHYFVPLKAGYLIEDAQAEEYSYGFNYPSAYYTMQYFAAYGEKGGVYIGIEDGDACVKRLSADLKDGICTTGAAFYGIGATLSQNSFKVSGQSVWQYFEGDWYDAAMIYSDFVKEKAAWLPEISEDGRMDTAERYKHIPFWVSDYIPNSETQGDNKPMNLSAGSDIYEQSYWHEAPLMLKEKLNVPIAYHVYNWHEIPFNIEYPHFLPAKEEFTSHTKELRSNDIYIFPYINGMAWEMHDADMGHEVNFLNTGCKCAAVNEDGSFVVEHYPQKTLKDEQCSLAISCGTSLKWHQLMMDLSRQMEETLEIDGIYFDEIAASSAKPCYQKDHAHLPGGGSYWVKGYNKMMREIRENRENDNFYFTECNAEPYMKDFDGFLTWEWVDGNEVPAFPAVYAGYIQMVGRCTIGLKKDDFDFFKYCTAKSFVCGQQLGWCKADIVYSEKHMDFLKGIVNLRYEYAKLFNCSSMLRPPVVSVKNLPKYETKAGLWFTTDIVSEYVLSGAWQYRNKEKTVIFAVNIFDGPAEYELTFNAKEYGIIGKVLPAEFVLDGDVCRVSGTMNKNEIKVWEV